MKKVLALILALVMALSLVACGKEKDLLLKKQTLKFSRKS